MIRLAISDDILMINNIYNQAVDSRKSTADLDHITLEDRIMWFAEHDNKSYPVFVKESDERVVAWTSISPYRKGRRGLSKVVEVSYYVDNQHFGKGIASELMNHVINHHNDFGFQHIICILLEINKPSIYFLEKFGFEKWGDLPNIVDLEGMICNHYIYGKTI